MNEKTNLKSPPKKKLNKNVIFGSHFATGGVLVPVAAFPGEGGGRPR
jgi:hypothetical protein